MMESNDGFGPEVSDPALREAIHHLHEDVLLIDRDFRVVAANATALRHLGRSREETVGRRCHELTHGYDRPCPERGLRCALQEVFDSGTPRTCLHVHRGPGGTDRQVDILMSPLRDASGRVTHVIEASRDVTDLFRARRDLRRAETRHAAILMSIGDGVIVLDAGLRVERMNPAAEALTGWPAAGARGRPLEEVFVIVNECTRARVENPVARALREGAVVGLAKDTLLIARDGREIPITDSAAPIPGAGGRPDGAVMVFRDRTAERSAQRAAFEAKELLEETGGLARVGGWDMDAASREVRWTEQVHRMLEVPPGSPLSFDAAMGFIHPDDRPALNAALDRAQREGREFDLRLRIRTASDRELRARMIGRAETRGGQCIRLFGAVQDITELRQAEAALRRERNNLVLVLSAAPTGMLVFEPDETVRFANPAAERILGGASGGMTGRRCGEALRCANPGRHGSPCGTGPACPPCPFQEALRAALRGETDESALRGEAAVDRAASGAPDLWLRFAAAPVELDGRACAVLAFEDVTERRSLEQQLRQAQKLESIGRLAGGVAHDFNNQLQAIMGYAELALQSLAPDDPLRPDVEELRAAALRSANLTRQLLAFARRQTIRPRTLDLNETIEGMLRMLRRLIGENIELVWVPAANLWPVHMDAAQVDQILANLLVNARDAIEGVGRVTLHTANAGPDEARGESSMDSAPGDYAVISVSDDGCGMDEEVLARLFEPFFTTKELGRGTGLGLATVYGIVKQNGGWIDVRSRPERGTEIRVYLPRDTGEPVAPSPAEAEAGSPRARGGETILVVEDERFVLELARRELANLGYRVLCAGHPDEALRLLERRPESVDLLVTDVVMPGMSGGDLVRRARASRPGLRCLFMSGHSENVIAHSGVLDPGVRYIQKPFGLADLAEAVRGALDDAQPASGRSRGRAAGNGQDRGDRAVKERGAPAQREDRPPVQGVFQVRPGQGARAPVRAEEEPAADEGESDRPGVEKHDMAERKGRRGGRNHPGAPAEQGPVPGMEKGPVDDPLREDGEDRVSGHDGQPDSRPGSRKDKPGIRPDPEQ